MYLTLGLSTQSNAAEIDAEATRDAGRDYATALRIRITNPIENPSGKSAQWRGILKKGDTADAYKFSPTPAKGQLLMFGIQGKGGPVTARFVDRKSGETLMETQEKNGINAMVLLVEKSMMLVIDHIEGDPDRPYSATIIMTKPEEVGIVTPDAATKAFAEAMKRKPKMTSRPDGFSLIVPPKDNNR